MAEEFGNGDSGLTFVEKFRDAIEDLDPSKEKCLRLWKEALEEFKEVAEVISAYKTDKFDLESLINLSHVGAVKMQRRLLAIKKYTGPLRKIINR